MSKDTRQQQLPGLPEYHGKTPTGMKSSVTGSSNRVTREHTIGERFCVVLEVECSRAGHEGTSDGLLWVEKYDTIEIFEVPGAAGTRLLSTLRSARSTSDEYPDGSVQARATAQGEIGFADGNGIVLTPAELAERRGVDPTDAMLGGPHAPAVVVYDDDYRRHWPSEFPPDTPRPHLGATDGEGRTVERVLDSVTGEDIAEEEGDGLADVDDGLVDIDDGLVDLEEAGYRIRVEDGPITPTAAEFEFVDCDLQALRDRVKDTVGYDLRRLIAAEQQGRGRGLQPRKGALAILEAAATLQDGR